MVVRQNYNSKFSQTFINDHNQEAHEIWNAFNNGKPIRPPVRIGTTTQYFIFNDYLNPRELVTFENYSTDAKIMLEFSLKSAVWRTEHIAPYCDDPIGLPDQFVVRVDFQNFEEATYFGAPLEFLPNQVPDTRPILTGDRKNALFDLGVPDPFRAGWYGKALKIYEEMQKILAEKPTYLDRPIIIEPFGYWTGGILTLAIALRGHELMTDFYEDPDYVDQLLSYLTEVTILRVRAYHEFFNLPYPGTGLFFTDDAIQMISVKMLKKFLLPLYQKYKSAISIDSRIKMHLCGDASRHFKTLKEELGVYEFETGFPIDFGKIRKDLGPDVTIQGGPNIMVLRDGTPEDVSNETKRILNSGILEGGKFILREGNNLAPHTPLENINAMYQAARQVRF